MDIGIDRGGWEREPALRRPGSEPGRPDWHGLIARLSAGRAALRAISQGSAAAAPAVAGSFDPDSARALSEFEASLGGVNPVFWANCKSARTMDATVVDETSPGDREC